MHDITICTLTVMVTPAATAATIEKEEDGADDRHLGGVVRRRAVEKSPRIVGARGDRGDHHEDERGDHERPAREVAEHRVQRPAHPGVARAGVRLDASEVAEREDDAEHRDAAVEQRRGAAEEHGAKEHGRRGGDRVRGRDSGDAHDDRVEESEDSGA